MPNKAGKQEKAKMAFGEIDEATFFAAGQKKEGRPGAVLLIVTRGGIYLPMIRAIWVMVTATSARVAVDRGSKRLPSLPLMMPSS